MANKDNVQMTSSDFNLEKLNTRELSEHIAASIKMGENIAVVGRRGTGKTQISKQEIEKAEMQELYLNMSVLERVDMGGYPRLFSADPSDRYVKFLLPSFYETLLEGDKKVVCLLDEIDKADPSLWAPLLEITQFRSINGRALKNLHAIIMTGNLISEGGSRPSLPLLDRAEKYLLEADASSWLTWAGKTRRIHPSIVAYINDHPKDLFGAVDPEERYADPSPRGWDRASQILFKGEAIGWNSYLLNKKVAGCVGKDAGIKYSNYYEHYIELLPMVEDVYKGHNISDKYRLLEPSKQLIICMIICARLATFLDQADKEGQLPKEVEYIGKFFHDVSHENVLVSVRSQIQIQRLIRWKLDDVDHWSEVLGSIQREIGQ